tara:strand:+ start:547 stop:780 length:234 start_codon:yes stop_codon:yes gene_type:complete
MFRTTFENIEHTVSFQGDHWDVRPPHDGLNGVLKALHNGLKGSTYLGSTALVEFHVGNELGEEMPAPDMETEEGVIY